MPTTIRCNKCQNEIEITQAIRQELEGKILNEVQEKHIKDLEEKDQQLEEAKKEIALSARRQAIEKVRKEYDAKIESTKAESQEREKQNQDLQEQMKDLFKQLREVKGEKDKLALQFQKKLLEEEDKIKQQAKKETEEELSLKMAEKDKKLLDAEKQIIELQRKMHQQSQQLQGEVQELALERILKQEFPFDEISEVKKGKLGADVIQKAATKYGTFCGTIVWESKRTQKWSVSWVAKLKKDKRELKADIGVIVTADMPKNINSFGFYDGVWVCDLKTAASLAFALRQQLIKIRQVENANKGKASKAEIVYSYLISNEFVQRIEVWVEYFKNRREQIDKEKSYYSKKWNKEEKEIELVMKNTAGIYGDLQGLIGNALPKVPYLELPEGK